MIIKLADILPNPYRAYDVNPINEQKVEKLIESIQETGLWVVIVRPSPNQKDKYEQAFGHHRLEAARRAGIKEIDATVQNLSNEQMIMMLARDNDEVYNSSVLSVIESVSGVVKGLADGSLKPLKVPKGTPGSVIRYAPSFIPGVRPAESAGGTPYTTVAVGKMLGYTKKNENTAEGVEASNVVIAALGALYLMQIKQLKVEQISSLSVDALRILVQETVARINVQRKHAAERAKAEKERAHIEAEQKAFKAEAEAQALEALKKKEELEKGVREALREENEKLAAELAEKRKKAEEADNLRVLKNHTTEARRLLKRFGATSVTEGAAIELAVKEAEGILESKDAKAAVKAADKLSKISSKTTDAYFKKQEVERVKSEAERKGLPTRRAVKAMLSKLEVFPSEGYALRKELEALSRNEQLEINERELVRQALLSASDWFNRQAVLFLPPIKVDVLAESAAKARKAPPVFEAEDAAKKRAVQDSLDEAAQKRQAERDRENTELAATKAKVSKSKAKTKKEKK